MMYLKKVIAVMALAILVAMNLNNIILSGMPYAALAPTYNAFNALRSGNTDSVLTGKPEHTAVLENHVVPGKYTANELASMGSVDNPDSKSLLSTHPDIVKLPAMSGDEVESLLESQTICRMALNDIPQPYIIALDYVYLDGKLYFHLADYGLKMNLIKSDPHVSVEIDNFCDGARDYETITLMGELRSVMDKTEKMNAVKALIGSVKARGGEKNVAARHGLRSLDQDTLASPSSPLYCLTVSDYVALKSPGN